MGRAHKKGWIWQIQKVQARRGLHQWTRTNNVRSPKKVEKPLTAEAAVPAPPPVSQKRAAREGSPLTVADKKFSGVPAILLEPEERG